MTHTEPGSKRWIVRTYVVQIFQDPNGWTHGRVTEPATMRQWVFRDLAELPGILGREAGGPSETEGEFPEGSG